MEAHKKVVAAVVALVLAIAIFGLEPVLADGFTPTFCDMTKEGLQACRPYVQAKNTGKPSEKCCSALKGADFDCLCRNKSVASWYGVDLDQAKKLPEKCDIDKTFTCD